MQHIICVKSQLSIGERPSEDFAATFYSQLMKGNTILDSYKFANLYLSKHYGDDYDGIFELLPSDRDHSVPLKCIQDGDIHIVTNLPLSPTMTSPSHSHHVHPNCLVNMKTFIGRNEEAAKCYQILINDHSMLAICGEHGIGKSALGAYIFHYSHKRLRFPGGMYYIDLADCCLDDGLPSILSCFSKYLGIGRDFIDFNSLARFFTEGKGEDKKALLFLDNVQDALLLHLIPTFLKLMNRTLSVLISVNRMTPIITSSSDDD
jgi:hypothetical protein